MKLKIILPMILFGILLWDMLSSIVISKREFFWGAHILYPLGILKVKTLLIIHDIAEKAFTPK